MFVVERDSLSDAWADTLCRLLSLRGHTAAPAIVRFPGGEPDGEPDDLAIREVVDAQLSALRKSSILTVANTIFPQSIWLHHWEDREEFFTAFLKVWPRIKRYRGNDHGTYFYRLVNFEDASGPVNQLKHIIETWRQGNHRHSALQAGVLDPRSDHSHRRIQAFPCLHQIAFHPRGTNGQEGLSVVAFYANQLLLEKAYGNYLGLTRLGHFMAREMGLQLRDVTCVASYLKPSEKQPLGVLRGLRDSLLEVCDVED